MWLSWCCCCVRKSERHPKKKANCYRRCRRKMRRWCCKKIKNCFKKQVLGTIDPHLSYYQIGDYNLGDMKKRLTGKSKREEANTWKASDKKDSKLSKKDIPLELLDGRSLTEFKRLYSIKGSKERILENMLNEYIKGKLSSLNLPDDPITVLKSNDKGKLHKMLKDYDKKQKYMQELAKLDPEIIKQKHSLDGSDAKLFDKMIKDFRAGKVPAAVLSTTSKFDPKKIKKEDIDKILNNYETYQKSKISKKDIPLELLDGRSLTELKRLYSIKGSKERILENMLNEYTKGKLSSLNLPDDLITVLKSNDKGKLHKMLKDYDKKQKYMQELAKLDPEIIKQKHSLDGSDAKLFDKMIKDFRAGKVPAAVLSTTSKFDPKKIKKEDIDKILDNYETYQKSKSIGSKLKKSKEKIWNFMEDLTGISRSQLDKLRKMSYNNLKNRTSSKN